MQRIGIILFILIVGACTKSEFCITPSPAAMRIAFKTYDSTNTKVDTALKFVDVYSTDTSILWASNVESLLSIDVYPNRKLTQQTYVIFNSAKNDTVIVSYTPEENFISNGCGYQMFFRIQSVDFSKANIDSVNITDVLVTDQPTTNNLEVIYK